MVMNHIASEALTSNGRFVYSTEFFDLRTRLLGLPRARRYTAGGIYFSHLEIDDVLREAAPYFRCVNARPIRVVVPFTSRLGFQTKLVISRIAERIPFFRELGDLLLVYAENPIYPPEEGKPSSRGNAFVKALYNMRKKRFQES